MNPLHCVFLSHSVSLFIIIPSHFFFHLNCICLHRDSVLCPQPIDVSTEKFIGYLSRGISSKSDRGRGRGRGAGIGGDEESRSKSDLRLISMTVASVVCGNYHTAAITHTGRLLIWGACNVTSANLSTSNVATATSPGSPTRFKISNNGSGHVGLRKGNRSPKGNGSPTAAFSNAFSIDCSPSLSTSHLAKYDVTSGLGGVPQQVQDGLQLKTNYTFYLPYFNTVSVLFFSVLFFFYNF